MISGIKIIPNNKTEETLEASEWAFQHARSLGWSKRKELLRIISGTSKKDKYRALKKRAKAIRKLKWCRDFNTYLDRIEIDQHICSFARITDSYQRFVADISIPIFVPINLPCDRIIEYSIWYDNSTRYIKFPCPVPDSACIEVIKKYEKHVNKFDYMQLWFIPSGVFLKDMKDQNCILVGVMDIPEYGRFNFKLHTWMDQTNQVSWWKK